MAIVRKKVAEIVRRDFDGNGSHAAEKLGISQTQVSLILSGQGSLGIMNLLAIADYEGCSLDALLGRTQDTRGASKVDAAIAVASLDGVPRSVIAEWRRDALAEDVEGMTAQEIVVEIEALANVRRREGRRAKKNGHDGDGHGHGRHV